MSDFFVTLVLKTVVYHSKLLDFQDYESLELEHSCSNSDITDRHYLTSKITIDYDKGWQR